MNVKALGIYLGRTQRVGVLFQYALPGADVINRFVADDGFIALAAAQPTLSASLLAATPDEQALLWRDVAAREFNGAYSHKGKAWLLPAFFQNLLPEGVFRDHVAALRGCEPTDHFELLAACGKDLPGNVFALPVVLARDALARYVTQNGDALEMSVTADPLEEGVSLSGVQAKLGVIKDGERYVARTRDRDTHIIAKLPVVGQPLLPELEYVSLRLASAAGVSVCQATLEPLEKLAVEHGYDLGDADARTHFLAVVRYDRLPTGRVHCEDFAQVLGVMPENKYSGPRASYLAVAATLLALPGAGEPAVHELLRRILVNEMLGNPDMHLKNMGLWYPDGIHAALPPAYDIVACASMSQRIGHALPILPDALMPRVSAGAKLPKPSLTPGMLRAFTAALGLAEKPATAALTECVKKAGALWPEMIRASPLTAQQKSRLLAHFNAHPAVASLVRRQDRAAAQRPGQKNQAMKEACKSVRKRYSQTKS
ncbi:type II toxin-antitoxin system HipA family toxin [Actimicrobium antarcticum]|uniref:Type II toxin-antitoxin system HipA family toxin n=1 Tax=Actimicrobium antarcticum TaxID=1051899 RepID=A0ABP7TT72_9BURK